MNDTVVINNQGYLINNLTTNLNTGESSMELLNDDSTDFLTLTNVYYNTSAPIYYTYFYNSSIGAASNLAIGDTVYSNSTLTTTLPADTYYQDNSSASTTHCSQSGYIMTMVINSSGVITAIGCYQP